MPAPAVAAIERSGIEPVQPFHRGGEVGFLRLDHEVIVRRHPTEPLTDPAIDVDGMRDVAEVKSLAADWHEIVTVPGTVNEALLKVTAMPRPSG